jgi:S-formylglutathione hydrolase FrmB
MKKMISVIGACLILQLARAGRVDTIAVFSAGMKKDIKCVVISPDSYNATKKFPVVYLLHGYSGSYRQWITLAPQLKDKADELQILIVCPDGGYGSWYFDSPVDSSFRYETFVSAELIYFIDHHYKTIADRNHRAITGLSMGGHGGLFLSIRHKDVFGNAGSISGGVDIRPFPNNWDLKQRLGDTTCCKQNWEKYTVINVADDLKNKDLHIIFDCGVDDFFIGVNRNLHRKLLDMKIDHDYIERPGAHTAAYWKNSIDYQLLFFRKAFDLVSN